MSVPAGYPGTAAATVVHVAETIQSDLLYVDAVTSNATAAELVCKLNGATGLDNGATVAVACNRAAMGPAIYWVTIPFP